MTAARTRHLPALALAASLACAAGAGPLVAPARAAGPAGTLHVPADYPTIQAAVDAAADGDTIAVAPGTWRGNVRVDKNLDLVGTGGAAVTVLDGGGLGDALAIEDPADGTGFSVTGFTFTGGGDGLRIVTADAFGVADCAFTGNAGWGLSVTSVDFGWFVSGSRFLANGAGGAKLGQFVPGVFAVPKFSRCTFAQGAGVSAVFLPGSVSFPRVHLDRCTLDGGNVASEGSATLTGTILRGGTLSAPFGATVKYSDVEGGAAGTGNLDADPSWANPGTLDYALLPGSPCIDAGDPAATPDPDGSRADMGAVPWSAWEDLGGSLAGAAGPATLSGASSLKAGTTGTVALAQAAPSTGVILVLGTTELAAPFHGGTFWPLPALVLGPLPTDAGGALAAGAPIPAGLPVGLPFWLQAWWPDASAPGGHAGSNGLRGTTP